MSVNFNMPDKVDGLHVVAAFKDPATVQNLSRCYWLVMLEYIEHRGDYLYGVGFARWDNADNGFIMIGGPLTPKMDLDYFRANTIFADYVSRLVSRMGTNVG